jgi:hypothetical protein
MKVFDELNAPNPLCTYVVASFFLSMGLRNKGLDDKDAAIVKVGPRHWNTVPRISTWVKKIQLTRQEARLSLSNLRESRVSREHGLHVCH